MRMAEHENDALALAAQSVKTAPDELPADTPALVLGQYRQGGQRGRRNRTAGGFTGSFNEHAGEENMAHDAVLGRLLDRHQRHQHNPLGAQFAGQIGLIGAAESGLVDGPNYPARVPFPFKTDGI